MNVLAVVSADGGSSRVLSEKLDRGISSPAFTRNGASITFLVADDRSEYPAEVSSRGGGIERLTGGALVVSAMSSSAGHTAASGASGNAPPDAFPRDAGT